MRGLWRFSARRSAGRRVVLSSRTSAAWSVSKPVRRRSYGFANGRHRAYAVDVDTAQLPFLTREIKRGHGPHGSG
ncbi:hypothetical protein QFZ22_006387 [Streptomyces canus]|uniref:Uncharacterized protein n=1 Tax=Streptomyces canus TaxID=58343 RepID=A0AAW8FMW1_9ACTN|nr:hypothetical protein [Streptomyces canus]MDQ0910402.1 hypothetical protein [Streptomyces canus]